MGKIISIANQKGGVGKTSSWSLYIRLTVRTVEISWLTPSRA